MLTPANLGSRVRRSMRQGQERIDAPSPSCRAFQSTVQAHTHNCQSASCPIWRRPQMSHEPLRPLSQQTQTMLCSPPC
eukprot:7503840-Pyramimonas_sp.AAC.1